MSATAIAACQIFIPGSCLPSKVPEPGSLHLTVEGALISVRTGDLVLVSGNSFTSLFVENSCGSSWSHIGVIYLKPGDKRPYLFEAIRFSDDSSDYSIHKYRAKRREGGEGVKLTLFNDFLRNFKGYTVAIRYLCVRKGCVDLPFFQGYVQQKMDEAVKKYLGKGYDTNPLSLISARLDIVMFPPSIVKPPSPPSHFFCSALVAACYRDIGLIESTADPRLFLPEDFSKARGMKMKKPEIIIPTSFVQHSDEDASFIQLSEEKHIQFTRLKKSSNNKKELL